MKIEVQNGLTEFDKSIDELIQRRLRLALSKMSDKYCSLTLSLYNIPNIVTEETQVDLLFVIDRVIQKATRILMRKLSL